MCLKLIFSLFYSPFSPPLSLFLSFEASVMVMVLFTLPHPRPPYRQLLISACVKGWLWVTQPLIGHLTQSGRWQGEIPLSAASSRILLLLPVLSFSFSCSSSTNNTLAECELGASWMVSNSTFIYSPNKDEMSVTSRLSSFYFYEYLEPKCM